MNSGSEPIAAAKHNNALPSESAKLANACSRVSKQDAIAPQIEKMERFEFDVPDWKDATELKSVWAANQRDLANAAQASMDRQADVYLCLAKAHAILSQRGDKYAKMRDEAGILNPKTGKRLTWTEYFSWFQSHDNFDKCLRTVQHKLAENAGKKRVTKKRSGFAVKLTAADKRKLVDGALESHRLVEGIREGNDLSAAVKELQKALLPKDKLLELANNAARLLKSDNGSNVANSGSSRKSIAAAAVDWNKPPLQAKVLGLLTEISEQVQQGELAVKVRTVMRELLGHSSTAPLQTAEKVATAPTSRPSSASGPVQYEESIQGARS